MEIDYDSIDYPDSWDEMHNRLEAGTQQILDIATPELLCFGGKNVTDEYRLELCERVFGLLIYMLSLHLAMRGLPMPTTAEAIDKRALRMLDGSNGEHSLMPGYVPGRIADLLLSDDLPEA